MQEKREVRKGPEGVEADADKAFDIRLIAEAAGRACARRRRGWPAYIDDGDSSLKVESWAVTKLNPA